MVFNPADPEKVAEAIKMVLADSTKLEASEKTGISTDTITKYMKLAGIEHTKVKAEVKHADLVKQRLDITRSVQRTEYTPIHTGGKRIAVIGDMQVKPDIDLSYCKRIGRYMADKKPDIIVNIGDFADMPSLSSHEAPGSKATEGARYENDILAVQTAMRLMMTPIKEEMARTGWSPRLVLTLGNHEHRITRAIQSTPKFEETIGLSDLHYEEWGWEVIPFLQPITIEGIVFCHYLCSGVMGRPVSSARALLTKKHMSCIVGHQQGRDIAFGQRGDGKQMIAIISGSCLAAHHKVLTSDLRYVPLGGVKIGDKLVSFDEHLGMSDKRSRRFKAGIVTNVRISSGEMFDVTLSNGKVFRTTKDHKWLTKNCMGVTKWQETQNLTIDGEKGYGTKVSRVMPEWETLDTRQAGWLAGMYDGEGSLYARKTTGGNCTQLAISQCPIHNPGIVESLIKAHRDLGFELGSGSPNGRNCRQWRITNGQAQVAKFLGSVRPERLLSKFQPELLGTLTTQYKEPLDSIISVESAGIGEYVEIEIDAATMVVEGYPHHNCYEHEEGYLNAQTNNHWRGLYILNDVKDGVFEENAVSLAYIRRKYGG